MSNDPVPRKPHIASYQLALLSVLEAADLITAANGNDAAAKPGTGAARPAPHRAAAGAPEGALTP